MSKINKLKRYAIKSYDDIFTVPQKNDTFESSESESGSEWGYESSVQNIYEHYDSSMINLSNNLELEIEILG
jgi:hypothetical protein